MSETPEVRHGYNGSNNVDRRVIARLALYAGVGLLLLAASIWLQLSATSYAVMLLILLGLVVRFFELHQRERRLAKDVSRLNAELRRALAESETLRKVSREISGQVHLNALLDLIALRARDLLGADYASVATVVEETGETVWRSLVGFRSESLRGVVLPPGKGLVGVAITTGRPVVVEDFGRNPAFPVEQFPYHRAEGMVAAVAVPLVRSGRTLGSLVLGYRRDHSFVGREIDVLNAMAAQAAVALENARLYEAEKRKAAELEAVVDHMVDGVVITDREGTILRCNGATAELLGELAIGARLAELGKGGTLCLETATGEMVPPERWPMMLVARGERVAGLELVARRAEGTVRHLSVDGRPVVNEAGEVDLGVTVLHDVTGSREMDQLKDEFLALAAHELKTPLTSIKGYAQILLRTDHEGVGERERRALRTISQQVDRVDRMVEQFLRVAELRSGKLAVRPARIDLSAIAEEMCEELGGSANGCEIRCSLPGPVEVMADRKSVALVLSNLLHNAIRFSPAKGRVEVAVVTRGQEAVVSVLDQGVGIPKAKQEHVFERFYQVEPGARSQGGIGLGLYISQQMIERQGGRMWLESEEGQGSNFFFSLPLAPRGTDRPTRAERRPLPPTSDF